MMDIIREIIYAVIIVCVPILTKHTINALKHYAEAMQAEISETRYQMMSGYVAEVEAMLENIVKSINQMYVNKLKEAGEFTKESQQEAFNAAVETAKQLLSEDAKTSIQTIYGDVDNYIKTMIESYVGKNKITVEKE